MNSPRLSSTNINIVTSKQRDQMYMKHLREVERINNRQAQRSSLKQFQSINELRQKYRLQNKHFHAQVNDRQLLYKNEKIKSKIKNIRSMFGLGMGLKDRQQKLSQANRYAQPQQQQNLQRNSISRDEQGAKLTREHQQSQSNPELLPQLQSKCQKSRILIDCADSTLTEDNNQEKKCSSSRSHLAQSQKRKPAKSFHFYYRKKQQNQIEMQNERLIEAILSKKSPYKQKANESFSNARERNINRNSISQNRCQQDQSNEVKPLPNYRYHSDRKDRLKQSRNLRNISSQNDKLKLPTVSSKANNRSMSVNTNSKILRKETTQHNKAETVAIEENRQKSDICQQKQ